MKRLFALITACILFYTVMYGGFITNGTKYYLVKTIMFSLENGQEVIEYDLSDKNADYIYVLISEKNSAIVTDKYGKKFFYDYEGKTKTGEDLYSMETDFQFYNGPMILYLQIGKKEIVRYSNSGVQMYQIYKVINK